MPRPLLALLLLPLAAGATTERPVDVACPLCGNAFRAMQWGSTNSIGGQDRDFLEHAAGGQVFLNACWTCPSCRYTGFHDDFEAETAQTELLEKLRKENPLRAAVAVDPKLKESWKLPAWVRYDLWIQVLRLRPGTTQRDAAFAHLRVAQTQRFDWEAVPRLRDFDARVDALWNPLKPRLEEIDDGYEGHLTFARELEKGEGAERDFALLLAAWTYAMRGEDPDAARVLAALKEREETEAGMAEAIAEIEGRLARARAYTLLAIPLFLETIAKEGPEREESLWLRYLVGELHRKTGEPAKALAQLEPLLEEAEPPEGLRAWVEEAIAKARR